MRKHPIIQCVKCHTRVRAQFGDTTEFPCGEVMLEIAAGGYLRVHTAAENYQVFFEDEDEEE